MATALFRAAGAESMIKPFLGDGDSFSKSMVETRKYLVRGELKSVTGKDVETLYLKMLDSVAIGFSDK